MMLNETYREERIRSLLERLSAMLITRVLDDEPSIEEGSVLSAGPPPYRRLDCDGRALAYVRARPRKVAVRIDLSGLWVVPGRSALQVPSATGAALFVRSIGDIELAVHFLRAAVHATRAAERSAA